MKVRPNGFLGKKNIDHDSEIFDYIRELHEELWQFVRIAYPEANGSLRDIIEAGKIRTVNLVEKGHRYEGLCK